MYNVYICLFVTSQVELTGNSLYDYIHPGDLNDLEEKLNPDRAPPVNMYYPQGWNKLSHNSTYYFRQVNERVIKLMF